MNTKVALVEGIRTPFCKAFGKFKDIKAKDLAAYAVRELLVRIPVKKEEISEVIFGNVIQPPNEANLARIIALLAGLPVTCPAFTINRNCASGLEALVTAAHQIILGKSSIIVAGGVESMSHFPIVFSTHMRDFLRRWQKAKTIEQKIQAALTFRLSFLKPQGHVIKDPLCSLTMGQTAEIIAREFKVTREEQDRWSLLSHERAYRAQQEGFFVEEIVPVPLPPHCDQFQIFDDGPRADQTLEQLAALTPAFDKAAGLVTAGNASQVTDGAVALLLMSEAEVQRRGIKPLGYMIDAVSVGLEPRRMGLGPVSAITQLLQQNKMTLEEIDLIEINEAFAAQIVAVEKALAQTVGKLDRDKLNVNGGAIALGHPLGASGARLVLTLLRSLRQQGKRRGIASLCVGGGQGEAILLEGVP